jgi:tetratricopeptide (TPR) repeat protein
MLALAFVTTGFAQAKTNSREEAYYHFSKGRLLDDQGQPAQAVEEYQKALEQDPNNSLIYSEMASSYLRNNRLREAVEAAQKAIQADHDNVEAHKLLSTIYLQVIGRANAQQPPSVETINSAIHEFEEIIRIDPTERQALLMLGRLNQIKGDRDKAAQIYKQFMGVEPGSEEGVTALAKLHMDAGNYKEAIELLEDFVKQRPDSDGALQTLGEAYSATQQYSKAAQVFKHASELDPDDVEIKRSQAQAAFLADDIDTAAKIYEDLLKVEPEDGVAHLRLGQIYRRQQKYQLAQQHLQKAAEAFPDNIEIQFNLVLLDRDQGHIEDALKLANDLLKKTEKSNGRYTEGEKQNRRIFMINQGILNQTLGNYNEAVRTFQDAKALTNDSDGRMDALIIETYRISKNLDKALQYADQALATAPNNRQLEIVRADVVAERGKVDEGIKALQQMQKGNDDDLEIYAAMVSVYQRARRFDDAQNVLNKAAQRFPNEEQVYFLQGSVYEKQKKYNDAEKAFRKALDLQKDDPAVMNYLGFMFADRGIRLDEAERLTQKAIQTDPTNGAYLDSLGWVYFKQNRLDRAEEYLRRAIIFLNTDSSIHDHLGDVYFKTKRFEEARTEWNKSLQLSTEQDEIDKVKKKLDELKTTKAAKK